MSGKIANITKGNEGSSRDSLGFGGLILISESTDAVVYDADTYVAPWKYISVKDGTQFTSLSFIPSEGVKKNEAIDLVAAGIVTGTTIGEDLLPPVVRVPVDTGVYELVSGTYTAFELTTGRIIIYGES